MTDIAAPKAAEGTAYSVIFAVAFCHMLNDAMQSLLPAIYPSLKTMFALNFTQIGLITLVFQITASLLQPLVGLYGDRKAVPYLLPAGACFTLAGLLLLGLAQSYAMVLVAASVVGMGSSVFHPESSRVARMAAGGRFGFAQSTFQVGGNMGSAIGPLLAAFVVLSYGHVAIAWCSLLALVSIVVLWNVGRWYQIHGLARLKARRHGDAQNPLPRAKVIAWVSILLALIFSKFFYMASITSYYTFYLIRHFHLSVRDAQLHLFLFLAAVAVGTLWADRSATATGANISSGFRFSGRAALHAGIAVREPVLDERAHRRHRAGAGFGVLGHRGLWPGIDAGPGRHGVGPVLRFLLRHGRAGRGPHRRIGRSHQRGVRLPGLFFPAGDRVAGRIPAQRATLAPPRAFLNGMRRRVHRLYIK